MIRDFKEMLLNFSIIFTPRVPYSYPKTVSSKRPQSNIAYAVYEKAVSGLFPYKSAMFTDFKTMYGNISPLPERLSLIHI